MMNNALRKFLSTVAISLAVLICTSSTYAVDQFMIYQDKDKKTISSGLSHETIRRFTSTGWVNINVLRVNLSDEYTNIKPLFSKKGIIHRDTIGNMVKDWNAIAGINADFFYTTHFSTPIGPVIKDSEFVSSPNNSDKPFPILFLNNQKVPFIDFLTWNMQIIPQGKPPLRVYSINKDGGKYEGIMMFDSNWSDKTVGNRYFKDLTEVVVVDNTVVNIQTGHAPLQMPQNGYVLTGRGFAGEQLIQHFKIGDTVSLQMNTSRDISDISAAVGGGSVLIKNGVAVKDYAINMRGKQPRTSVGITKDGNELIIVTVDGRHTSFKGLTQAEITELMSELGSYNAINFDGGGSTTMVLSPLDKDTTKLINYPSDGSQRRVINGLGIFNNAPIEALNRIEISSDSNSMLLGTSKSFFVKGYDIHNNPIQIKQDDVIYSSNIDGVISSNKFTPKKVGSGKLYAKYKGIKSEVDIKVLDSVKEIQSDRYDFDVDINGKIVLKDLIKKVYGLNDNGFSTIIDPNDITWKVYGNIGEVKDGVLYTSKTPSSGILNAQVGGASKNFYFSVGYIMKMLDAFESANGVTFDSYPKTVEGSVISSSKEKDGQNSLKLNYDFTKAEGTSAAYAVLRDGGITLKNKADKLGLWVYGNNDNHWLRAEILDNKGKTHRLTLANHIDWSKWKWVTAKIPSYISYPITIKKIYVAETSPVNMNNSFIIIDGLKSLYHTPYSYEKANAPNETEIVDSKKQLVDKTENGYNIAITSGVASLNNLLDYQIANKLNLALNSFDISIILDKMPGDFANIKSKQVLKPKDGFSTHTIGTTLFMQINDTEGGIRQTNPYQWTEFLNNIKNSNAKNIIISLPKPVFGSNGFSDNLEANLFHKILKDNKDNKDIWVVQTGNEDKTQFKDGIRYIHINNNYTANNFMKMKYLMFTVNNDKINYSFKKLFE
ncbi:phosphodiester glycosidase family protein [Clostridiaceae bacterium M8S5]|nr:phosphodiester glycosidase family protein [Clostridiaceae bacterium M8S5]